MPIDPGTGALINQLANPPDPMARVQTMYNALTAQKNFQAQQAAANAYQQSVDPQTGAFDMNKFNALTSQGPGAWNFGETMKSSGGGLAAQGQGTQQDLSAKQQQMSALAGYMTPLIADVNSGKGVTAAQVQAALASVPEGLVTPQMRQNVEKQLSAMQPGDDASNLVRGAYFATMNGAQQVQTLTGNVQPLQTGPQIVPTQLAPFGQKPTAAPLTMALTPQNQVEIGKWLQEPYEWDDRQGTHQKGTKADYYTSMGIPLPSFTNSTVPAPGSPPPAAAPTAAAPGAPGPLSSVTTGREPVKPAGPAAPAAPAPPPSTSALPPEQIKAGRDAYAADQALQATLGSRVGPLSSALSVLRAHPDMQTVGQDELNQLTQVAHAFGFPVGDLTQANAYQELSKNLEQYLRALPGANRSDLAQSQAGAASPHIGQGRGAMTDLLAKAVGYERMRAAGVDYFNSQYGDAATAANNSAQYKNKTTNWLASQDPVAYSADQMTPQQYQSYVKGLSASDKQKFVNSRKEALKLYPTLKLPGSTAPAQPAATAAPAPNAPTPGFQP
ncbi:MAG TPA: hypothetical protein VGI28_01820 [Stellaceae bacterium]